MSQRVVAGTPDRNPSTGTRSWSGGVLVALSAAIGILCGVRAIARLELPRTVSLLGLEPLPREGLGVAWTQRALWPADLQALALERLIGVTAALFVAAAVIGTLNVVILLAESASERRSELAVRSAVGASPMQLVRLLLRSLRALMLGGLSLGLVAGVGAGAVGRALWPAARLDLDLLGSTDVLAALALVIAACVVAYLASAWKMARGGRAAVVLRAGTRGGADPLAVFVRKALTATHAAVAGAVLLGAVTLASTVRILDADPSLGAEGTTVVELTAPAADRWTALRSAIREIPGIEAESLAAPGALVGLGVREIAVAECGRCSRGLMPAPLWNAVADHHAVGPGYFELAGVSLVAGRGFDEDDRAGAEPVALVNETFARTAFERGQPIGKKVRIGSEFTNWYTVVGVVDDVEVAVLGADETARAAVYLSALQQPTRSATLLLRGDETALDAAETVIGSLGFAAEPRRSLAAYRADAVRELRWSGRAAALAAFLALLLAANGVYVGALQTTRRRTTEIAIRRAVGATPLHVVRYVLGERLRIVAWGMAGFVFLGTLLVALLQNAAGVPAPAPVTYVGIGLSIAVLALAASVRAAREALAVEPARVLE